jgi:hypothetical protein
MLMSHGIAFALGSAAVLGGVVVTVALLVGRGADRGSGCGAVLIPAYLPPSRIVDLVRVSPRPRTVVINPHNGPGLQEHEAYRKAVREVQHAGTRVLGYVRTAYGTRPASEVTGDVDRYRSWYGVDGIFLDEASPDVSLVPYYAGLARHVRAGAGGTVVLNPGVVPAPEYFGVADVVVTFEGAAAGYATAASAMPDWLRRERPDRVAHLIYAASRDQALSAIGSGAAGYIYATSGLMPNPWRTLPPYLHEEEAMAGCR